MRRLRAFRLTRVRRIAHDIMPLAAMRIVAARTIYDPQAMCGTKRRTSMRKESRARTRVRMLSMKIPRRYRGEWDGEWRCAAAARIAITRVKKAAMGCTIRMVERVARAAVGRSKLSWSSLLNRLAVLYQHAYLTSQCLQTNLYCIPPQWDYILWHGSIQRLQNPLLHMIPMVSA